MRRNRSIFWAIIVTQVSATTETCFKVWFEHLSALLIDVHLFCCYWVAILISPNYLTILISLAIVLPPHLGLRRTRGLMVVSTARLRLRANRGPVVDHLLYLVFGPKQGLLIVALYTFFTSPYKLTYTL